MVGRIKNWLGGARGKADKYQQTVVFAEANHPDMADGFAEDRRAEAVEEVGPSRLLVVGNESAFSDDMVSYALGMAQRMSYEIVALNAAPLSCRTFRLFSDSRDQLCHDFKGMSEESAEAFREKAVAAGIPFTHIVKFDETEAAVEEVMRAEKGIEFVIADTAETQPENRIQDENRPRNEICVYSMSV
mgnify:CR=1 FL=1